MKYWNEFITREDLENEAGEIDENIVRALSINTGIRYLGEFIELGGNDLPYTASDHVEELMTKDIMYYVHATENRIPSSEEIRAYMKKPENVEIQKYWTFVSVNATKENWPEFVKKIREKWNIPEEVTLKNEKLINQKLEVLASENGIKASEL